MKRPRLIAAQSFSTEEVEFLDALFRTLLRGGDARGYLKRPEFQRIYRKVLTMRNRIRGLSEEQDE